MDNTSALSKEDLLRLASVVKMGEHGVIWLREQITEGGPFRAWYPNVLATKPQPLVTLHGDGLEEVSGEELAALEWLIATSGKSWGDSKATDIELKVTQFRSGSMPGWASGVTLLSPLEHSIIGRKLFDATYKESLRPDWEHARKPDQAPANILDLNLHKRAQRHDFVTLDEALLSWALVPERQKTFFALRPTLARRYVDLCLRAHGEFRVQPNHKVNRGLYYWQRLWTLMPSFPSAWSRAVFGEGQSDDGNHIHAYMHALYARLIGMMQAYDRAGWLRYNNATNDTRDEVLNQLNYFIVLATGVFDSIAWLAKYRFQIAINNNRERQSITVRRWGYRGVENPFFAKLEARSQAFANYLRDPVLQAKIMLFYEPRDSIQHRLVLTGAHLNTGQYLSDCVVVFLDADAAAKIAVVDRTIAGDLPFSEWGVLTFAESGDSLLEPYRFMGTALEFVMSFADGALRHLDLEAWLKDQFSGLAAASDAALQDANAGNGIRFATPFLDVETKGGALG